MVICSIPVPSEIAALFTRISQRPCFSSIKAASAATLVVVADIDAETARPRAARAELSGRALRRLFLDVSDHDGGTLLGEPLGDAEADALGAACHHRDAAVQPPCRPFAHLNPPLFAA